MATWQFTLLVLFVLLPFSLMMDFWPRRERCDARGHPLPRDWRPRPRRAEPPSDDH